MRPNTKPIAGCREARLLNRWQRRRLYPPPPPTPEGMCWRLVYNEQGQQITGLVPAAEAQAQAASKMEFYDSLDRWERDRLKQDTLRKRERGRREDGAGRQCIADLSVRANNVLQRDHFDHGGRYGELPSPDEVWRKGREYWLHQPNCGRRTVNEITLWLASHKLLWDTPVRKARKLKHG